jgi:hypothetical protein
LILALNPASLSLNLIFFNALDHDTLSIYLALESCTALALFRSWKLCAGQIIVLLKRQLMTIDDIEENTA